MTKLVDLHCHILPYVDDGALRTEESEVLLDMLFRQGVRVLCATPHLRKGCSKPRIRKSGLNFLNCRS